MSKLLFFTDPHLGVTPKSHTTSQGRGKLSEYIFDSLNSWMEANLKHKFKFICLGDLFDTYSNKEAVVDQGLEIARMCDVVLAGNHDLMNRADSFGSLQLVQSALEDKEKIIISPDGSNPHLAVRKYDDDTNLYFIPHCFSQKVFADTIKKACKLRDNNAYSILCLHCNVGEAYGKVEDDSTTLALTPELQKLTEAFDLVMVGHEHSPSRKGNIQVMGNFFPISFGEIADRYSYVFDTKTKILQPLPLSKEADQYFTINVDAFLNEDGDFPAEAPLVEITGDITMEDYPKLGRALMKFWKENSEHLFLVKNSTKLPEVSSVKKATKGHTRTLPELVKESASKAGYDEELMTVTEQFEKEFSE